MAHCSFHVTMRVCLCQQSGNVPKANDALVQARPGGGAGKNLILKGDKGCQTQQSNSIGLQLHPVGKSVWGVQVDAET